MSKLKIFLFVLFLIMIVGCNSSLSSSTGTTEKSSNELTTHTTPIVTSTMTTSSNTTATNTTVTTSTTSTTSTTITIPSNDEDAFNLLFGIANTNLKNANSLEVIRTMRVTGNQHDYIDLNAMWIMRNHNIIYNDGYNRNVYRYYTTIENSNYYNLIDENDQYIKSETNANYYILLEDLSIIPANDHTNHIDNLYFSSSTMVGYKFKILYTELIKDADYLSPYFSKYIGRSNIDLTNAYIDVTIILSKNGYIEEIKFDMIEYLDSIVGTLYEGYDTATLDFNFNFNQVTFDIPNLTNSIVDDVTNDITNINSIPQLTLSELTTGSIEYLKDVDVYTFTIETPGMYYFDFVNDELFKFKITNSYNQLFYSNDYYYYGTTNYFKAGQYFIQVLSNGNVGSYDLSYQLVNTDDYQNNGFHSLINSSNKSGAIEFSQDTDLFDLEEVYQFNISTFTSTNDIRLLVIVDGVVIDEIANGETFTKIFDVPAYWVMLSVYSPNEELGTYSFDYTYDLGIDQ